MTVMKKISLMLIVVVSVAGIASVLAQQAPEEPKKPDEYAFADLGARCAAGAINYQNKAEALTSQADKDKAALDAEVSKTQAMIYNTATSTTSDLNTVRSDYLAAYNSGFMTEEQYRNKMAQLEQAQTTYGNPSNAIQSELNRIQAEGVKKYAESKQKVADMNDAAVKLQACADSAKSKVEFTTSDVADFEALISNSQQ